MTRFEKERIREQRAADRAMLFVTRARELAELARELDERDMELIGEMVKRFRAAAVTGEFR